ncbi:MAG: YdcF family protein [Proteobacteria bacterium]|nr:YdcF family protein [Pseudomonadota bacterium]
MRQPPGPPPFPMFFLKKLLSALVLPPLGPLLLVALGLLLLRRHPRMGKILAWGGLLAALLLVTPASVTPLVRGLEERFAPVDEARLRQADAILILGGGTRNYAPEFGGRTVNRLTLERLRYGARLARHSGLPVMVSGGSTRPSQTPEAVLMKAALEDDFGIPVKWMEARSRDTRENAELSAAALLPAGIRRIVLVTHAAHMERSVEAFEHAGFQVMPAPTANLAGPPDSNEGSVLLPSMNTAYAGWYAVHEWLGLLAYRLSR